MRFYFINALAYVLTADTGTLWRRIRLGMARARNIHHRRLSRALDARGGGRWRGADAKRHLHGRSGNRGRPSILPFFYSAAAWRSTSVMTR